MQYSPNEANQFEGTDEVRGAASASIEATSGDDVLGSRHVAGDVGSSWEQIDDPVEYHYKFALKLRPNFALAALNLGAWQHERSRRLGLAGEALLSQLSQTAERTLVSNCAIAMHADKARDFNQHVQTQIECLISGARMHLETLGRSSAALAETKQTRRETAGPQEGRPEQTFDDRDRSCSKIYHWMQLASSKAKQIRSSETITSARPGGVGESTVGDQLGETGRIWTHDSGLGHGVSLPFGDLSKQMATIDWIRSKCVASDEEALVLLQSARSHALESRSTVDSAIYLDHVGLVSDEERALQLILQAFDAELAKVVGAATDATGRRHQKANLVRLLGYLTNGPWLAMEQPKRAKQKRASLRVELLRRAERALDAFGSEPDDRLLSLAGQLAYDLGEPSRSEHFYGRALSALLAEQTKAGADEGRDNGQPLCSAAREQKSPNVGLTVNNLAQQRRSLCLRLGKAHANYGAILQVNGHPSEARKHYRHALDCDPNNLIAATNLRRISTRR